MAWGQGQGGGHPRVLVGGQIYHPTSPPYLGAGIPGVGSLLGTVALLNQLPAAGGHGAGQESLAQAAGRRGRQLGQRRELRRVLHRRRLTLRHEPDVALGQPRRTMLEDEGGGTPGSTPGRGWGVPV